jgi:hypothetical protein
MAEAAKKIELTAHAQRRQTARDLVDFDTIVVRSRNIPVDIRLVDLSPKGFHARCGPARFERGETVSLRLPLVGMVEARVMWSLRGCFGSQFLLPIDARTYLDLLAGIRSGAIRE